MLLIPRILASAKDRFYSMIFAPLCWSLVLCLMFSACQRAREKKISNAGSPVSWGDLEQAQDGRFFHQGQLFSGVAMRKYETGEKLAEVNFKDGLLHGKYWRWHKAGWKQMEMRFVSGVADGEWVQWQADGLVEKVEVWRSGESVETRYGDHITKVVKEKETERIQLNDSLYAVEEAAQLHEKTFVSLWDDIRSAKDKWLPLEALHFDNLVPAVRGPATKLDWGIERVKWLGGGQLMTLSDWRNQLAKLRGKGVELVETEWHQERFDLKAADGMPRSEFKFLLHVQDKVSARRYLVRGKIAVTWTSRRDEKGNPIIDQIEILETTVWLRDGPLPFASWENFDPWKDAPPERRHPITPLLVYDLNRDGLSEVVLAGSNLVYWNQGSGNFNRGILCNNPQPDLTGAVVADFDGDGRADMLASFEEMPLVLYKGDVQGRFSSPPKPAASIPKIKKCFALATGDVDGDGDLDVYLTQYKPAYEHGHMPTPFYDANDGDPAYLLLNDGHGSFADATQRAGLSPNRYRRTYSASFTDLDADYDLDLVVVNDFAGLDYYLNDGKGRFTDMTSSLGDHRFSFGMSHVMGDFNGDGKPDLYMVGMGSTTARRLEAMGANRKEFPKIDLHRMKLGYGNRLLLGDGAGGMTQSSHNNLVARTGWGWGSTTLDFDNDGDEDIYVGNGNISGKTAQDYCTQFWRHDIYEGNSQDDTSLGLLFEKRLSCLDTISWNGFEHNVLLMNEGAGVFSSVGWLMNVAHEFDSRSVVSDDLDADGRPDLLVVRADWSSETDRPDESLRLQRNKWAGKGNWIGVRLHEHGKGFSPIGARITVQHPGGMQFREVIVGDSIMAQHSNHKHIGLGSVAKVDSIEVRWPNGKTSGLDRPAVNRYHEVKPK